MNYQTSLIVDDHVLFADGLANYIHKIAPHVQCSITKDVAEAMDLLEVMIFDFVFIDIHLANAKGLEVINALKLKGSNAFVIAMSGDNNAFFVRSMLNAGAASFISKATNDDELKTAVQHVLSGRAYVPAWLAVAESTPEEKLNALSPRLLQVAGFVVLGKTNKEIALLQDVTEQTIKTQKETLFEKTGVSNTTEFTNMYSHALRNLKDISHD
jgi:DNA-binding NarL/FixJ family response regulator